MSTSTQPTSPTAAPSHRPPPPDAARLQRFAGVALFAAIALACVQPQLLVLPFIDRTPIRAAMAASPDRGGWYPQYPAFLSALREQTKNEDSIALLVPPRAWDSGYSYAYYRASYFLAGREVLPIVDETDQPLPQNVARANYLAVWHMPPPAGWRVAWQGHEGALLVR